MSAPSLSYQLMLDLLHVQTVDDLRAKTQRLTATLGFDYFMYGRRRAHFVALAVACGLVRN